MNKALAIMYMFPGADPSSDFIVLDDDGVQTIIEWNIDAPEPTEDELQQAWEEYLKQPAPEPPKPLETQMSELKSDNEQLRQAILELTMMIASP
ncbi:XkdW family protein [Paenibacillus dokdonensis]|uniref:XkdW family protein n=1 Tax=Paenibacillus dokdonensis TaxID=2567944 RepID=A0ABU6GTR5_9BACL|nr:XkdW family protein [Paenibacillus dokdonensis]MEC0242759.1 XkdW family protein [Paenibacillus dokdonensis]